MNALIIERKREYHEIKT